MNMKSASQTKSSKRYIYVANWKLERPFSEAYAWCKKYKGSLQKMAAYGSYVICPDFTALAPLAKIFKSSGIQVGAQNCAAYACGAYTGEVSAQSLMELGCTHCIVGHAERRYYYGETDRDVSRKIKQLVAHNITPIACIRGLKQEGSPEVLEKALCQQMDSILTSFIDACTCLSNQSSAMPELYIAYEPLCAIGSGRLPSSAELMGIFTFLREYVNEVYPVLSVKLCYGGSVNPETIVSLKQIDEIDGFLIGKASLDFQSLKKIVLS
jgi:triosephosphate isomerase (TIM)